MKFACMALALVAAAVSAPAAEALELLKSTKDWAAYKHDAGGEVLCFASSRPKDMEPKKINRGEVYVYLSFYPKDGVSNEPMILIGYPVKEGSSVVATIGADSFKFFAKDDKAFIEDPAAERKFVEAIKKGDKMVVKGTSAKGTVTTDLYSLFGVSTAIKDAEAACSS